MDPLSPRPSAACLAAGPDLVFRLRLEHDDYLRTEAEDLAGNRAPTVTYKVPYDTPEGRPGRRYFELIREAARQRGLPADYVAFLDGVETKE